MRSTAAAAISRDIGDTDRRARDPPPGVLAAVQNLGNLAASALAGVLYCALSLGSVGFAAVLMLTALIALARTESS